MAPADSENPALPGNGGFWSIETIWPSESPAEGVTVSVGDGRSDAAALKVTGTAAVAGPLGKSTIWQAMVRQSWRVSGSLVKKRGEISSVVVVLVYDTTGMYPHDTSRSRGVTVAHRS